MTLLNLRELAERLDGEVDRQRIRFSPPGHSKQDRSAWVEPAHTVADGFYVGSFANDDPLALRDHVKDRLGISWRRSPTSPGLRWKSRSPAPSDDAKRIASALAIWEEADDPRGTLVETYLRSRGLVELPEDAVRFHPNCPFDKERTPAMVALVRDSVTNEPKAIHRTALDQTGRKIDRRTLAPIRGGAIKLTPDEHVTNCLGIGEGIETTLSMRLLPEFGASPVWSLLTAGNLASLPALPGIECLWVAVDHDPAGIKAAHETAARWHAAGREVLLIKSKTARSDLNDLVQGAANAR